MSVQFEEAELCETLSKVLLLSADEESKQFIDSDLVAYLAGLLADSDEIQIPLIAQVSDENVIQGAVYQSIGPFLESSGCEQELILQACEAIHQLARDKYPGTGDNHHANGSSNSSLMYSGHTEDTVKKLKQGLVSMSSTLSAQSDASADSNRFLWGADRGVAAFINVSKDAHSETTSAKDKRKQRQELERARKEFEAKARAMEEEEKGDGLNIVTPMVLPDYKSGRNEKDVLVRNVGLSLDNGRILLDNAELRFAFARRYGLVGKNGIGKTVLLKAIASLEIQDFPKHHRILHVRQEVRSTGNDLTVIQAVLQSDVERSTLLAEEKALLSRLENIGVGLSTDRTQSRTKIEQLLQSNSNESSTPLFDSDLKRLNEVYARLAILSSDSAESRAIQILSGLQFTPAMQSYPLSALSGGWRHRVQIAAALFIEPDILMLDEPTNHLDLEAVLWLESYLVNYKHTLIVVSHDRSFLNEVCTDIIEFKNQKLTYYKGNYDAYVKAAEENVRNQMRQYQAYQDKRAHLMEFIDKFRANAKRASLVQSRIKAVEKMDLESPGKVEIETFWRFSIPNPEPLGRPIIAIDDAFFDYKAESKNVAEYLLQKVNFGIDLTSRLGILGPNGSGKSTLLKMITSSLRPLSGSISINGRCRIGIFTQHSADKFDLRLSALENLMAQFPDAVDQEMRSFVGRFQIQGDDALKPMMLLSGGQKSRVAFAALAFQKPHVIIMDEPTNHLDMESIDALVEAAKDFKGGLVVVSHDQYFITNTCSELWVVGDGQVCKFKGDFELYKNNVLERTAKRVAESVKTLSCINNN